MMVHNSPQWLAWTLGIDLRLLQTVAIGIEETPERYYRHKRRQTATNKIREIDEPIGDLRFIQERIKERLLAVFPFPATFHGCVPRRSSKSNAEVHQQSPCLVRLDLADYYPHATCQMVYDAWQSRFQVGPPIASLLTRLTTVRGHLPQGAVTSGYVGNLVLLSVSTRIEAVAEGLACSVTFYVDDIAFSGANARQVIQPTIEILRSVGLSARHRKTEIMPAGRAQVITGYVVNRQPSVSTEKREAVRRDIHRMRLAKSRGEDVSSLLPSLRGRIAYVRMTNPGSADRMVRLLDSD
jgi:hypothetical protein